MKRIFALILSAALAALTVVVACAAPPKLHANAPRKLGASLDAAIVLTTNDAGVPVDEAGIVSFGLVSPVAPPFGDPVVDHCNAPSYLGDFASGTVIVPVTCGNKRVQVTVSTGACNATILSAAKAQAATQLNVSLQ